MISTSYHSNFFEIKLNTNFPCFTSPFEGKMQHSVWVAEIINSNLEVVKSGLSDVVPAGVLTKQISFRRIWQGKGSNGPSSKVFNLLLYHMVLSK